MTSATATADGDTRAPLETAWAVGTPMTPLGYYPKYGPLPAVVEVRDQTGPWDATGQTRQLMLSDGGFVIEHLVRVDRDAGAFVYELSDFQKLFGRLVSGARAEWEYRATNTGAHVRWTYTFFARPGAGLVLKAIVRFAWAPYMRKVLPGILAEIDRHAEGSTVDHPRREAAMSDQDPAHHDETATSKVDGDVTRPAGEGRSGSGEDDYVAVNSGGLSGDRHVPTADEEIGRGSGYDPQAERYPDEEHGDA